MNLSVLIFRADLIKNVAETIDPIIFSIEDKLKTKIDVNINVSTSISTEFWIEKEFEFLGLKDTLVVVTVNFFGEEYIKVWDAVKHVTSVFPVTDIDSMRLALLKVFGL